ncbi:MAG: acyltransferase family protein, partial [Acidocella sp.]|nr:acyltransferase family protein [Acidocella sp.]
LLGVGLVLAVSLTHGGLNTGFAWQDFELGGARVLFPFVAGVMLWRYANNSPRRLGWAHMLWLPLLLILCSPAFAGGWYDAVAVLLLFPALLLGAAHAPAHDRLDPVWRRLGGLSYPLYVVHYPFVVVVSNLLETLHAGSAERWLGAVATMAMAIGFATLAAAWYDAPLRAWLGRRTDRPTRAVV